MLAFCSASESVGLERSSSTINSLVQYLPRVLGAVFILAIGLFVATFARDSVRGAAKSMDSRYAKILGRAAYVRLAVIAVALAIGQLELEAQLLAVAIAVPMTAAGVGAALAFGLGAREVAANLLAGAYLRDSYPREPESAPPRSRAASRASTRWQLSGDGRRRRNRRSKCHAGTLDRVRHVRRAHSGRRRGTRRSTFAGANAAARVTGVLSASRAACVCS